MINCKVMGIYKIQNTITNEVYIGQSIDIYNRWGQHKRAVYDKYRNEKLYLNIREYGLENFVFEIISVVTDRTLLNKYEAYFISKYDSFKNGLNSKKGESMLSYEELLLETIQLKELINELKGVIMST